MGKTLEDYLGKGAKVSDNTIVINRDRLMEIIDPNRSEIFDRNTNPILPETADEIVSLILATLYKTAAPPNSSAGLPLIDVSQSVVSQSALENISFVNRDGKKFLEHKFNFNVYTKGFEVFPLNRVVT